MATSLNINMTNSKKILLVFGLVLVGLIVLWLIGSGTANNSRFTFTPGITSAEAIEKVKNLAEVQEWLLLFSSSNNTSPITGGKPIIEIDSISDENYIVHAYEQTFDHTATFGWYGVNEKTGVVKREN